MSNCPSHSGGGALMDCPTVDTFFWTCHCGLIISSHTPISWCFCVLPSFYIFRYCFLHSLPLTLNMLLLKNWASGKMASALFTLLALMLPVMAQASVDTQTYIIHTDAAKVESLDYWQGRGKTWADAMLDSLSEPPFLLGEQEAPAASQLLYVYDAALSGFSAKLSAKQAESIQRMDGVLAAYPDELIDLHTTYSPQFLGLAAGKGLWSSRNLASDVIVGVVDTGIWPEHVSFSDAYISGTVPARWKGQCDEGTNFSATSCNRKLIGARAFWKGYEALGGVINETSGQQYHSARDSDGHGTHTASTAAGNVADGANLFGNAKGSAKGMRYASRVAAYKACWKKGCASSDLLAAVDQAVVDGVDVLSMSLGGVPRPFYADSIAIATFGAVKKGVFVSCSAGNSGPFESTVSNVGPWIMTVAASYVDRRFPTSVKLGNGQVFEGASLYSGSPTKLLPVVYGETAGNVSTGARQCLPGSLSVKLVKGKMVLCDRGISGRTQKGEQVKLAGGVAMLLLNSQEQGEELFADAHVLPASALGTKAAKAIKSYVNSSKSPEAAITFLGTTYGEPAPMMASFSSRGPSLIATDIIKPDVTAPGMSILAAWPPTLSPSLLQSDPRRASFNIVSGTSMSCPHVTGLAALLKAAHPDWSAAAIKSALMTTAYTVDNRNGTIVDVSSGSPATPFTFGSGHVDPERASNPGLVYDITPEDYLNYLCGLKYTSAQVTAFAKTNYTCSKRTAVRPGNLNYPSFAVVFDSLKRSGKVTQTRTVTNVAQEGCRYAVSVREPRNVRVTVKPKALAFSKPGQKLSYKVKFSGVPGNDSAFGELVWACGRFAVRSPIAVTWQ